MQQPDSLVGLVVILAAKRMASKACWHSRAGRLAISLQWNSSVGGSPRSLSPWVRVEPIMASSSMRRICIFDAPSPVGVEVGFKVSPLSRESQRGSIPHPGQEWLSASLGQGKESITDAGPLAEKGQSRWGHAAPGSRLSCQASSSWPRRPRRRSLEPVAQAGVGRWAAGHPGGQPVVVAQQRAILQPALHGHHVGAGA